MKVFLLLLLVFLSRVHSSREEQIPELDLTKLDSKENRHRSQQKQEGIPDLFGLLNDLMMPFASPLSQLQKMNK